MPNMRAKFSVSHIEVFGENSEKVHFRAVGPKGAYPEDGSDENNTYAKWSPSANCDIHILNPALTGKFAIGDTFYVDFTPAPK